MRDDIDRRPSRMSNTMIAALSVVAIMALLLMAGPWSPRIEHRDPAGLVVGDSPRPLPPGTPVTLAPAPAVPATTH